MRHLLSIQALSGEEIARIVALGIRMKAERGHHPTQPLAGQCWALMFSKASTRTRVSFEVGVRELGGDVMFLSAIDIQLGRGEPIKDTARVMGRMLGGAVIRTFAQSDVEEFAQYSGIPTINALTDDEHPCQILADLQTIKEKLGDYAGRKICFVGDGACNVAQSWIWAAAKCGFELTIASPPPYQPPAALLEAAKGKVRVTADPEEAARGAEVLYTDVWVSMGKEEEAVYRMAQLAEYQINRKLVAAAAPGALVMHCLPAYREKEITDEVFEDHAKTIFDEAENRLHAQKAVLWLLSAGQ
ncbi:MAG: ornithine carbamoyltransferase [Chthoniobacteraceae bacterium]|jgi:ornithine carbamoyltransferase